MNLKPLPLWCALLLAGAALPLAAAQAAPSVSVIGGWFRYITPVTPAGGYMRLDNRSARPQALVGASSPACGMAMLHRSISKGGTDRMVMVRSVPIPPGGSVAFAPGGYHIMCMHPRMKPGAQVPVSLRFANGQRVTVPFTVYGAAGKSGRR